MSDEAKQFIFGLEQCRSAEGMIWHGKIPREIAELFDVQVKELSHGYTIAGVYVVTKPLYEPYTPEWLERGSNE